MPDRIAPIPTLLAIAAAAASLAAPLVAQPAPPETDGAAGDLPAQYPSLRDPRYGLLTPVPEGGDIPPIVDVLRGTTPADLARRAEIAGYAEAIRSIRHRCFRDRGPELRAEGLAELREFTDPAAFGPLVEQLRGEDDDIRLAVLDHLAAQGDDGQGALAWAAVHEPDARWRHEATARMVSPVPPPVLAVLDATLRSDDHTVVSHAGTLAGSLNVLEAIPLLIPAQVGETPREETGDLAWIAVQNQTVYVQSLQTVVGNAAAVFQPVLGVLSEGFVLRVQDAVVIFYRVSVHHALVAMTSYDWQQPTGHLGYDVRAWWDWYNTEYVPFKNEQALIERMAAEPPGD